MKPAIALTLLAFGLAGCGEQPKFNSGTVVEKKFIAAHNETYMEQQYAGESCSYNSYSKSQSCSPNYIWVTKERFVPDHWKIKFQNCSVYHKDGTPWVNKDGTAKCFTKTVTVDQIQFHSTKIGQEFSA